MEQQHLLLPLLEVFEPSFTLPKPLTGDVVFYVLNTLDCAVGINHGPGSVDAFDGSHLVEEAGGNIFVNCPALVSVVVLLGVEREYPALFLPHWWFIWLWPGVFQQNFIDKPINV